MKKLLIILAFTFVAFSSGAQGFTQSVGIRASWINPGIEYRYYTGETHSLRALLSTRDRGLQFHALTEFYQYDLFPFSYQLIFIYGAGVHVGYESWDEIFFQNNQRRAVTHSSFLAGLDGLIGLEYIFYAAPVKIGFEIKPFFDVFGRNGFDVVVHDFAFTVNYLF